MTILFIYDDPAFIKVPADILKKKGYAVFQAFNIRQALDFLSAHTIRIVVFALEKQEKNGRDLCRKIRNEQKGNYVYFIIAAQMEEKNEIFSGLTQGVDSYISWPLDMDELEALIAVGMRISGYGIRESRKKEGLNREDIGEYDILLARMALENELITKELLAKAFSIQKKEKHAGAGILLGDIFLEKEMIPPEKLNDLHAAVKKHLEKKSSILAIKKQAAFIFDETVDPEDDADTSIFRIQVSEDKLEAVISLKIKREEEITSDDILAFLSRKNIVSGVADVEKIANMMSRDLNEKRTFLIAKGKPAFPGSDASIKYFFDTDPLKAGVISPDGSIDYRERGSVQQVRANDLLAVKTPMREGAPGRDVHNVSIPIPETTDIELKYGEGVRLSEDGLSVYAEIDGQPNLSMGGYISVFAELVIDGDVDFNTGNINFDGNLVVKGVIRDGFTVKCGHLHAAEILGATLMTMGDIVISGGVYGADIKTEGSVKAKFITDSNVKAFGNVMVEKEVIQSKIRSSGSFIAPRGKIISSFISAKMGFEAREVGTDVSSPCRINVGMDENVKKRIQGFNYAIDENRKNLEIIQKKYEKESKNQEAIHFKIAELAQIQERLISAKQSVSNQIKESKVKGLSGEIKRMETNFMEIQKRMDLSEQEMVRLFKDQESLDDQIARNLAIIESTIKEIETISDEKKAILKWSEEERGTPVVKVTGHICQGTKLFGVHSSITLQETTNKVMIKEVSQPDIDIWQMMIFDSK